MKLHEGRGSAPPENSATPARKSSANGNPNRKRTCVAPTVPSVVVSSRCIALRAVCPAAANTVKTAQSQVVSITLFPPLPQHQVVHVGVGRELPAVGDEIVDHA